MLRLSGPAAGQALAALAGPLPEPRRAVLRSVRDPESGELLDRGLAVWFPGPASFTGEDAAELHLHGAPAAMDAVQAALMRQTACARRSPASSPGAPSMPGAWT